MVSKDFWKSKLFWLGIAELAIAVLTYIINLPAETTIGAIILGILTVVFRFYTNTPISGTPGANQNK